jgi:hypothetical protein
VVLAADPDTVRSKSLRGGTSYPAQVVQRIRSGGLWGIESDSDASYIAEVEQGELADLRSELKAVGFSTRQITAAFRDVRRGDD